MLGRLIKASAIVIAVAPVCLVAAGCSSAKIGAAAVMTSQRITIAALNNQVINLNETAKRYPAVINLSAMQATQQALTWLIRYQINDELARQNGITVTAAQAQAALAAIYASAKASAQAQGLTGVSLDLILAANGIPPDTSAELGRYQAIQTQYVKDVSGGTIPTSTSGQAAAGAKLEQAQCQAARALDILVNPQFGRMDYSQAPYQVVTAPSAVSGSPGPAPTASPSGTAPPC